jgi:hypothetical protein
MFVDLGGCSSLLGGFVGSGRRVYVIGVDVRESLLRLSALLYTSSTGNAISYVFFGGSSPQGCVPLLANFYTMETILFLINFILDLLVDSSLLFCATFRLLAE